MEGTAENIVKEPLGDVNAGKHVNVIEENGWATTSDRSSLSETNECENTQDDVRDFCENAIEKRTRCLRRAVAVLFGLLLVSAIVILLSLFIAYPKKALDYSISVPVQLSDARTATKENGYVQNGRATKQLARKSALSQDLDGKEKNQSTPSKNEGGGKGSEGTYQNMRDDDPLPGGPFGFESLDEHVYVPKYDKCIDITIVPGQDKYDGVKVMPITDRYTCYIPTQDKRFCSVKLIDKELVDEIQPDIVKTVLVVENFPEISVVSFYATDASGKTKATQFIIDSVKDKQGVCTNYIRLLNDLLNSVAGKRTL